MTSADGESSPQICTIPVQPGWHDPAPLLGYLNPLGDNQYAQQEFLRFLIRATDNPSEPHVCILDEMNLSHPEQYLAPILSAMEREGSEISLHSGDADAYGVPLDAKYRARRAGILDGMAESAHLYQDALRWGARRAERTFLLVPNAEATEWLSCPDYIARHHVGVVALRPDLEPSEWFRELLTDLLRTTASDR